MPTTRIDRARALLGTVVTIRAEGKAATLETAVEQAFAAVADVQCAMSFHAATSTLSRINAAPLGDDTPVDALTWRVLRAALALARATGGVFDPTVAGRVAEAGFLPAPSPSSADPLGRWTDVVLRPGRCVHRKAAVWLDLGGIAKGFAVDRAVAVLRRSGVRRGVVNAGGDLRVFGAVHETIRARMPDAPAQAVDLLALRDGAAATSASYYTANGTRTALLDPRTGACAPLDRSVTVVAPRAIWADALTKVVMIDPNVALPILRRLRARAAVVQRGHTRYWNDTPRGLA